MKTRLLFLILFYAFAKAGIAQTTTYTTEDVNGIYGKSFSNNEQEQHYGSVTTINRSIILSPDGRFEYHNFRQIKDQEEEHWYAQGNWTLEGKVISFTTTEQDINDKYTINLNNSKARFFKKSPRNTSLKAQPTYIRFFKSDNRTIQGLKLFKNNE